MCTSISYLAKNHYFGRTLDYEHSFNERIIITPRKFPFAFRHYETNNNHYSIIGIGAIIDGIPLYFDATNEAGLSMAGLNFQDRAIYNETDDEKINICSFEIIPWILSSCKTVDEAKELLYKTNILKESFSNKNQATPLHWMISDRDSSITVECISEGLKIYYNPIGVLTNCPDFPMQIFNLNNYMSLSPKEPQNNFTNTINLNKYSRGMGALGLPGDNSSMSRFVRAAFTKLNSPSNKNEAESVTQFFNILSSVNQVEGTVEIDKKFVKTIYTSCCNTDKGIYYYKTYNNSQINAIDMNKENLDKNELINYNLIDSQQINYLN